MMQPDNKEKEIRKEFIKRIVITIIEIAAIIAVIWFIILACRSIWISEAKADRYVKTEYLDLVGE